MGQRGPAQTSKKKLAKRGSWRADERPDDLELEAKAPNPPTTLKGEALSEWKRVVPELSAKGVLTKVDRAGLVLMCLAWAEFCLLEKEVKKSRIGTTDWKRIVSVRNEAQARWRDMASRFGLTPADRTRVKVGKSKTNQGNGKDRFFGQGRKPKLVG